MINLSKTDLNIVRQILLQNIPDCDVWVFGSRAGGKIKPHSDLDLVIKAEKLLASDVFFSLKEAFEESDLPFRVDIVQWCKLSDEFKGIILNCYEVIQRGKMHTEV